MIYSTFSVHAHNDQCVYVCACVFLSKPFLTLSSITMSHIDDQQLNCFHLLIVIVSLTFDKMQYKSFEMLDIIWSMLQIRIENAYVTYCSRPTQLVQPTKLVITLSRPDVGGIIKLYRLHSQPTLCSSFNCQTLYISKIL